MLAPRQELGAHWLGEGARGQAGTAGTQPARALWEGELEPALGVGEKRQQKGNAMSFSSVCWGMDVGKKRCVGSGLGMGCSWIFGLAAVGGGFL